MPRSIHDKCLNCDCTRYQATIQGYECATGRWGMDGEFDYDNQWPRHRWTAPTSARTEDW